MEGSSSEAQPSFRRAPPAPTASSSLLKGCSSLSCPEKRGCRARTALGVSTPHSFESFRWGSFGAGRWHLAKAGTEKTKRHPREQQGQPCRAAQPRGGMTLPPPPRAEGPSIGIFVLLAKRPQIWRRAPLRFSSGTVPASPPPWWTGHPKSNSACCPCPGCLFAIKGKPGKGQEKPFCKKKKPQTNSKCFKHTHKPHIAGVLSATVRPPSSILTEAGSDGGGKDPPIPEGSSAPLCSLCVITLSILVYPRRPPHRWIHTTWKPREDSRIRVVWP